MQTLNIHDTPPAGVATGQSFVQEEDRLWAQFANAGVGGEAYQLWLGILCHLIKDVSAGMAIIGGVGGKPFVPVAKWAKAGSKVEPLVASAERALRERAGIVIPVGNEQSGVAPEKSVGSHHVAYPLDVDGQLFGVVVLEVAAKSQAQLQDAMKQLHWASAWLETVYRKEQTEEARSATERLRLALELITTALPHDKFVSASLAFVTDLAVSLRCNCVSLGVIRDHHAEVVAVSHSTDFKKNAAKIRAVESAMDESYDQGVMIVYSPVSDVSKHYAARTHAKLSKLVASKSVCTIPLHHGVLIFGAVTLEKSGEDPFSQHDLNLAEVAVAMVAPLLHAKREFDKPFSQRTGDFARRQIEKILDRKTYAAKFAIGLSLLLIGFLVLAKGDYRVTAKTVIEGQVQRVITAPFNGYVLEASARAGDVVCQGATLAVLDDKDLQLERVRMRSQVEQSQKQNRSALARHERAQAQISTAQHGQAAAQLELLEYQLARTRVIAPFDGVVVSGDLRQSLGAPIEKGQVLFQLAPLDAFRVILQVDERDIKPVTIRQRGELVLSSLPGKNYAFVVENVTPVAISEDGRNYFRVEAKLEKATAELRPGMEGIGKIRVGRRNYVWIWTHSFFDWLRVWFWGILP